MTTKHLQRPFAMKSIKDNGTFTGYGSIFGELDSYRDIVMKGAFVKSLESRTADQPVPMLYQHDARQPIGIYTTIKEDDIGLYVEGEINMDVEKGRDTHSLMKQRALTGLSIGYDTIRDEWDEKGMVRKLFELELWELSPVTFPAGNSARVHSVKAVAALASLSDCEAFLRDAGLTKSETLTFISRVKSLPVRSDSAGEQEMIQRAMHILQSAK